MKKLSLLGFGIASLLSSASRNASAAPSAPSGTHPRIWLTPAATATMKSKLSDPASAASRVVTECEHVLLPEKAGEMKQAGIQGYNWAYSSATCAMAYRLTGNAKYAAPAVTLFRAMLDDYETIGDAKGGDTVVTHDTGYGMRFFAAYSGLAYDWLYDAPGVDATLRAHARARFATWNDWYKTSGYLNDLPGSNYHAGYVFAKTLIAIAEAGEAGAVGDAHWADVTTSMFPKDVIQKGLAPQGALRGGDWPEGWQYGSASVLSYALAGRALEEQGVSFPEVRAWTDSLTVRFVHAMNPAKSGQYAGGDIDDPRVDAPLNPRALIATMAGPSSDEAASWAAQVKSTVATDRDICPIYDALAEARGAKSADYAASSPPLAYLASGTRNLFARSSWQPDAAQAVFTSAPRLVPDHQHFDASNFVLNRGGDHLVVDPTPYGSRSSLTANAITVDSKSVKEVSPSYAPSQSPEGHAEMPWARATADGVTAARSELGGAFGGNKVTSDVGFARRDWVFLPEGEVIAIDRVRTDDSSRNAYLRFRTAAPLALSGNVARGTVGKSDLAIHAVDLSSGAPKVGAITVGDCWDSNAYGQCAKGRFAATEYAVTLAGPSAHAVHVLDALGAGEAAADVASMQSVGVAKGTENAGVLGASVRRAGRTTYVVSSHADTAQSLASLTYGTPGEGAARHVVFDAPEDANGASSVVATAEGGRCHVAITAGGAGALVGRPLIFTVASAADGCRVDGAAPAPSGVDGPTADGPAAGGDPTSNPATGATSSGSTASAGSATNDPSAAMASDAASAGGCSASGSTRTGGAAGPFALFALAFLGVRRRVSAARARV